jgi:hypothetical protein
MTTGRSEPDELRSPAEAERASGLSQTTILLFDQDGHPAVPT